MEAAHGAPLAPGASAEERLLAELNPPQREAVVHGEGPLLVLAGAGSGKTRVLTHRIAWLLATGRARPSEILAITFTNKAAGEMRERVGALVGGVSRAMWVMTFHSACARILRAEAPRLGYKRAFTIYDEADSLRMIKRCMQELELDPKRFAPRAIKATISGAKNQLVDATDYGDASSSAFEEAVADTYNLYERRMVEASAMDFDDLLVRTVNLLELFADVREKYQRIFRWVLVDEYQDTNRAQYRLLQLIAGEHKNLTVVGDDFQCLVEGTTVTMGDGSSSAIEDLDVGDEVLSAFGPGDFRSAKVTGIYRANEARGIKITTNTGRELISTREHIHFAGYKTGVVPDMHLTYLMWKRGVGFRVGTSRVYSKSQLKPTLGLRARCFSEYADAAWVISAHEREVDARFAEALLSLKYRLPTQPFIARKGRTVAQSVVAEQAYLDRLFETIDTEASGRRLLADEGLSIDHPHHQPGTFLGRRRVLTITMCGERRGETPMHRISLGGSDGEGRTALEQTGLSVRPSGRRNPDSWKYETCVKDFHAALRAAGQVSSAVDVAVRVTGRFGADRRGPSSTSSLPGIPAASVRPGMAMFTAGGGYDVVTSVEEVELDRPVYDINVGGTHNFVANGLVTHNSIYSFRGAEIRNILDFERDFSDATTVLLEQNYRSTQTILDAANALIAHNEDQKAKHLWTAGATGEKIVVAELDDEHAEARYVASEINRLVEEGTPRDRIAVFYRMNAQSRVLEDTLVRFEIPYQVIGGTKFYDRAEIKDAIAYLSLIANPADAVSFSRAVNSPRRGIGDQTQARLLSHANTVGEDIWDVFTAPERVPALGPAALKAVSRFGSMMLGLRERAAASESVAELLEGVLRDSGYLESLEAERTIEAEGRVENLEELVGVAREFDTNRELEGEQETSALEEFLAQIRLLSEQDNLRDAESLATLMSLHNAKGLEYDAVIIIGCEEGVFPHSRSLEEGNLEEERRLCYVGVTRARERLWLSFARRRSLHGSSAWNLPSRFLGELPEGLVERHVATSPTGWSGGGGAREAVLGGSVRSGSGGFSLPERRQPSPPPTPYAVGDDVVHASFGEGVVTAVEAGSVVVVRFAGDGAERKLMADYAPLKKVA
jgi:DNA helicase II / ATP-dependent DNA helicase PcrA